MPWSVVIDVFDGMKTVDPGKLEFGKVDERKVKELLIEKHDFSEARVESTLEKLMKEQRNKQTGLGDFV